MSVVERALGKLRRPGDGGPPTERSIGSLSPQPARNRSAAPTAPRILIDRAALREEGYLPESGQDRQFANQYRQIKRPLIAAALSATSERDRSRLIMMASALPGDGKTFTSINLAFSMARERDSSVLLVDADAPKPHVSRIFGVDKEPGLQECLMDESVDAESLVLATDMQGLSVLPAGKPQEMAAELMASARMSQVAAQLLRNDPTRIILFDSSPLLVSSESKALAALVGQVLLVVRAAKTPRQAVLDAISQLDGEVPVQIILNQGRHGISQGYYGTYGAYGDATSGQH